MPPRLRQSGGRIEDSSDAKQYDIPNLSFNQSLTWRPGKAIPVADLLSRLENLSNQLRAYDEDQVDSSKFASLAQDLTTANLLGHKDKGVRAWAISCVVDVLKACAPEAPFSDGQLKDIFKVVINSIIPALRDPSNAYNVQHVYILHSLAESQSILLLADIEGNEELLSSLFTHAFDIFAGSAASAELDISKSVEYHMKSLLCTVVEEVDLHNEITDIIISQFLRVDVPKPVEQTSKSKRTNAQDQKQGTLLLKDYPPAYNMAKSICTTCQEKMTSQITQYFNAIIVDAGVFSQTNGKVTEGHRRISTLDDPEDEPEDFADLRKAHRLLRELWRASPDILINVIPQIEAELSTDSVPLRKLATETLGDLTAGIGIAGLAPPPALDPAAYPLPTVTGSQTSPKNSNPLLTPASPKPFPSIHRTAYQNFISRRNDKAPEVRRAWVKAAARIIFTSAGGIGLNDAERDDLLSGIAQMLRDPDDRVRIAALKTIDRFDYQAMVNLLGADGGLSQQGTVFSTLAERFTDRKHNVREEAMSLGAKLWGVASRDIEDGNEVVVSVLGEFPNRLLSAYFTNDKHIHAMLDQVMYESLVPLTFPPIKAQSASAASQRRKPKDGAESSQETSTSDPDALRARRILTLVRGLDTKSKQVFMGMQGRQIQMCKAMTVFLTACEAYNGGVIDDLKEEERIKKQLTTYIETLSKQFLESSRMSGDLWKFADLHNRRDYQLIRFAMSPEYDYRTMQKAIKELTKRIREGPSTTQSLIESLQPLLYRCALVVFNRSHVPAIMDVSRTDEHGLAVVAHEMLREISARNPEVLKTHIQALCAELDESSPSATRFEEPSAADTLKACAQFAKRYPSEVSQDRKFLTALTNFALFSKCPLAAKHAVSIILTVADRKELYAKELLTKALKDCEHSSPNFVSRLSAISQICLLAPTAANAESNAILNIMVTQTLHRNLSPSTREDLDAWEDPDEDETQAKETALRAMVNQCRSESGKDSAEEFDSIASPVFDILMQLITNDGEITPTNDTPPAQRNRLRLTAARLVLKLCSHKRRCEEHVTPKMFTSITQLVINPPEQARRGFVHQLKKYLGQNKLSPRWFTILFLLAFEPDEELRSSTLTWLRSRVQFYERQQQSKSGDKKAHQNVMESVFARLLSLLIHHPDCPDKTDNGFDADLLEFSKYIVFYLVAVATEENLSLIFHISQRIKQTQDNVTGEEDVSERLYVLSDLAQAVIRNYADMIPAHAKGANLLQTWPGSVTLPKSLFKTLPSHDIAQNIAEKNYLPEDTALGLAKLIREYIKLVKGGKQNVRRPTYTVKKRKSGSVEPDDDDEEEPRPAKKKKKLTSLPVRKTPKVKRASSPATGSVLPSRKSARASTAVTYAEGDSEEDDKEMEDIDRLASSPTGSRRASKKTGRETSPPQTNGHHDTNMTDKVDEPLNGVHVHEDDDAADINEEVDVESERELTPSPLKEKQNAGQEKNKPKGKTKAAMKSTGKDPPVRATRQTRSAKS